MKSLPEMIADRADSTPDHVALREKVLGIWRQITWLEYDDERKIVAHGLAAMGVAAGDRVGVLAENRSEWLITDLAALSLRAVTVGFYPTSPAAEVEHLLVDSGAKVLIAENQEQVDKAVEVWDRCPALESIVYLERRGLAQYSDDRLIAYETLRENGIRHRADLPGMLDDVRAQAKPDDLATLVYTSGTTGPPKGAMLSVGNIAFAIEKLLAGDGVFAPAPDERDVALSYLPLCHVAERALTTWNNAASGVVVHFAESLDTVSADLAEVQPTLFLGVPRIWEKMHSTILSRTSTASPVKRLAYRAGAAIADRVGAMRIGNGGSHTPLSRALYAVAYLLVFRSIRDKLGLRKVRCAVSATAPIAPEVLQFMLGIGVPVFEAYGMTENTAIATATRQGRLRFGTVGEVVDGIEVRLDDETGEVQTRHAGNFQGYWHRPDATADTFTADGWLRTGDVGAWDGTHLRIVGRIKDIIITAGGKNVSPAEIENHLKVSPFVKEAVVIGDRMPYLTALVGIEYDNVSDWAARNGIHYTTYSDLSGKPEVLELVRNAVLATNEQFARVEQIRKFRMIRKELDHEDGELTATRKVKRSALADRFGDAIADMYGDSTKFAGGDLQRTHS